MVRPQTVTKALAVAIRKSDFLPSDTTYATVELDPEGHHSDLKPPIVEMVVDSLERSQDRNTELAGHVTDSNGNHIGEIYRSKFTMVIQIDCITAEGSDHDSNDLGYDLRRALREYDDHQLGNPLPHPEDASPLLDVKTLVAGDGRVVNDLSMTPAMRRSRLFVEATFVDEFRSTTYEGEADYIANVLTPTDSDVGADASTDSTLDLQTSDN